MLLISLAIIPLFFSQISRAWLDLTWGHDLCGYVITLVLSISTTMAPVFVGPFTAGIDGQQIVSHSALSLQEEVRQVEEVSHLPVPVLGQKILFQGRHCVTLRSPCMVETLAWQDCVRLSLTCCH